MNAQLAFDPRKLEPQSPRELMESALAWIDANRGAFRVFVELATQDAVRLGLVRVKYHLEGLRYSPLVQRIGPVKFPNALSAAVGRILKAWYPELSGINPATKKPYIPLAPSKLDGVGIPPKPEWLL